MRKMTTLQEILHQVDPIRQRMLHLTGASQANSSVITHLGHTVSIQVPQALLGAHFGRRGDICFMTYTRIWEQFKSRTYVTKTQKKDKHRVGRIWFCLQNEKEPGKSQSTALKTKLDLAPQLNVLKPNKQQVLPQGTQASILFVKGAQRPSIHKSKTLWRWGRKLLCH